VRDVKPHVLRYWEQEFPSSSPVKRRGNRRYYQRQDVLMIRQIRACCTTRASPSVARASALTAIRRKQEVGDEQPDRQAGTPWSWKKSSPLLKR
jgi:DNA-binding transcriptional MerR regulator